MFLNAAEHPHVCARVFVRAGVCPACTCERVYVSLCIRMQLCECVSVGACTCVSVCVCAFVCARVWAVYARLVVVGRGNIVTEAEEEDKFRGCGSFQKPSSVRRPTNRDANLTRVY